MIALVDQGYLSARPSEFPDCLQPTKAPSHHGNSERLTFRLRHDPPPFDWLLLAFQLEFALANLGSKPCIERNKGEGFVPTFEAIRVEGNESADAWRLACLNRVACPPGSRLMNRGPPKSATTQSHNNKVAIYLKCFLVRNH